MSKTPAPRRTRQELAQAEVDRWEKAVARLAERRNVLVQEAAKVADDLLNAQRELEHALTHPALDQPAQPADDVSDAPEDL